VITSNHNHSVAVRTLILNQWRLNEQKEITIKSWLGNSVLWNRMYSAGGGGGGGEKGKKKKRKKKKKKERAGGKREKYRDRNK